VDLLSYGIRRRRRRCFQRANCQMCLEEAKEKNKKLDPPGDIMYLGFPILSVLVAVPKRGTSKFKQMAAVAMDKNGNP